MADKTATVRINADPRGLVQGLKAGEAQAKASGKAIESNLTTAATNAGKAMRDSTGRFLKQGAQEGSRGALNAMRDMESQSRGIFQRIADNFKKAMSGAVRGIGGFAKDFGKGFSGGSKEGAAEGLGRITAGGAQAAIALTGKAVSDANAVLEKATRLSIASRGAGEAGVDPRLLMGEFFAITQDIKGVTADQLADGAAKFVQMTGDLATARSSIRDFATIAMASGASVEDVAGAAAAISQQFGITDPNAIKETLSSLYFQGKKGAFEVKDMAGLFPMLASAGASFGLDKGVGGVKTLGGFAQIARSQTGSAEVAATNLNAFLTALKTNSDKLKLAGVNVYDKQGKTRDLPTLVAEMIAKVGGSNTEKKNAGLTDILTATGFKAIASLTTDYQGMFAQAKGRTEQERTAEAMRALRERIMDSINAAGDFGEVLKDQATASGTASSQMTASWERVVGGVSEKVLPKLLAFADRFSKMDGVIDTFVAGLGLAVDGLEQFNDFLRIFTGDSDKEGRISARQMEAGRQRQLAGELQRQLGEMQMRPEEIADLQKSDPAELERRRAKAMDLKRRIDEAEAFAAADEKRVEELRAGGGKPQDAINKAYGLPPAPAADAAGRPTVKVDMPDKELRARITNPKDIGAGPAAAPAPGWTPPRG